MLPIWPNNEPTTYGRFKQTGPENLEPYQRQGCKTWQRCAERTILPQHKYPPGVPLLKSLRGGNAPSRMRPKTKVKEGSVPRKPAKWHLSPSEKSSALTWQARGDQHQNRSITGEIFSKPWSDPHTASMPWPGRASGVSHPHLKQREGDGKSEAWPPEIGTTWTRPWECNPA